MKLHPAVWSLFLLLATGIVAAGFYAAQPRTGDTPGLTAPTTDNETFVLGDQRGRVVVLDFFQIWCESCAIVENQLKELLPAWNASEVRVVSVGIAPANELHELRAYQEQHNITWTVARDVDGAVEKFGVVGLPTLVVVDPDGAIVMHRVGIPGSDAINATVNDALALQGSPVEIAQYSLWGIAVVAAVASFFSPCAIGLLPGYVAHTVRFPGSTGTRLRRSAGFGAIAASGLLLVFLGIGGLAFAFGQALTPYMTALAPFVGVLFILVGVLLLARPYSLSLQRVFSPLTDAAGQATRADGSRGALGFFLYGIGYGAGAAGCTAPVLLNLVALGTLAGPATGSLLLLTYAGTAALLMAVLTVIVAGGRQGAAQFIRRHAHKVEVASALLFVGAGVFLFWFAWRAGTLPY